MSTGISADLKVPDLWYDLYARFLPGVAFVSAVRVLLMGDVRIPDTRSMIVLALFGYLVGLVTQPLSSRLVGWVHYVAHLARAPNGDRRFADDVARLESHQGAILSKMHGEAAFFVQMTILALAFLSLEACLLDRCAFHPCLPKSLRWPWTASAVFATAAFDVALRRVDRAARRHPKKRFKAQMFGFGRWKAS